jgi:hypothetical protein
MKLREYETKLVGKWIQEGSQIHRDDVSVRIDWLVSNHLKRITNSKEWGDWEVLFQDPDDGRYWELTYPQGEMQGGGPPALTWLSQDEARKKYQI